VRILPPTALVLLLALPPACDSPPAAERGGEPAARADTAPRARVVVLQSGPLHLEPDPDSPGVTGLQAGTLLDLVEDGGDGAWVRVATWDDRQGWLPASRVMDPEQWAEYGRALGGVSPILARPAYPVAGGRWAVEAPTGSAGLTTASTAWLLDDSARAARIVEIDSIENVCGGERYRFAALDLPSAAGDQPRLEQGLLLTPSGSRPAARRLTIRPLEPDADLAALARSAARELSAASGGGPSPPGSAEWLALGGDAAWAALSWTDEDAASGQAQRALALVFRRSAAGWQRVGAIWPDGSSAALPTPAWRPVAGYATGAATFPTILLLQTNESEGAHLDVWIEREGWYERAYAGYYWGC
jgi:hypothetical protein